MTELNTDVRLITIHKEQRFCLDCGKILPLKIPIGYLHTDCNPEKKHEMQNLRESSKARKLENEREDDLRKLHEEPGHCCSSGFHCGLSNLHLF